MDHFDLLGDSGGTRGSGKFHVLKESFSLIGTLFCAKLLETEPELSVEERAELALDQAEAFLAERKRRREAILKRLKGERSEDDDEEGEAP